MPTKYIIKTIFNNHSAHIYLITLPSTYFCLLGNITNLSIYKPLPITILCTQESKVTLSTMCNLNV